MRSGTSLPAAPGRGSGTLFVALGLLGLAVVFYALAGTRSGETWVNPDVAGGILAGRVLADGGALYVDWIDNNPPSWYLMCLGTVKLSRILGAPEIPVYHVTVLLFAVPGLFLLRRSLGAAGRVALFSFVGPAYVGASIAGNFAIGEFGQREQLFAIMFVPYLFWRTFGGTLRPAVVAYLALLGYFAMMKPDFLAMIVLVEAVHGWPGAGTWRDSLPVWIPLTTGCAFPLVLLGLVSPASLPALVHFLLPYHLLGLHGAYREGSGAFLLHWFSYGPEAPALVLLLVGVTILAAARRLVPPRHLNGALALTALSLLSIFRQHKFWHYHYGVFFALALVFLAYLLGLLAGRVCLSARSAHLAVGGMAAVLSLLLVPSLARHAAGVLWPENELTRALGPELAPASRARPILFISPSADFHPTVLHLGLRTAGPWAYTFTAPAMLKQLDAGRSSEAFRLSRDNLRELIRRERPAAVIFSPSLQAMEKKNLEAIFAGRLRLFEGLGYRLDRRLDLACWSPGAWSIYRPPE